MSRYFQFNDSGLSNDLNKNPLEFSRREHKKGRGRFLSKGSFVMFHRARIETDAIEILKRIKKCLEHQHGLMIKIISCNTVTYSGFEYAEIMIQIYYGPINKLRDIYEKKIVVAGIHPGERDMILRLIPCE
jgi:hypothetical protein